MKSDKEQVLVLKDGRTIFKTHNGFRNFLTDAPKKDGSTPVTQPITREYYNKIKVHAIGDLKVK